MQQEMQQQQMQQQQMQQQQMQQQQMQQQQMQQPTEGQPTEGQQTLMVTTPGQPTIMIQRFPIHNHGNPTHPIHSKNIVMERGITGGSCPVPYKAKVYCCGRDNNCCVYYIGDNGCRISFTIFVYTLCFIGFLIGAIVMLADSAIYNKKVQCYVESVTSSYCYGNGGGYSYDYEMYVASCSRTFAYSDDSCNSGSYYDGETITCYANSQCTKISLNSPGGFIGGGIALLAISLLFLFGAIIFYRIYLFVFSPLTYKQYCCYNENQ